MSGRQKASIFIATPVFRGVELVEETLRSIRDQEFRDFRVLISVDGGDMESAALCEKFAADSRFEVVVQPQQLGWAANLNWLMQHCDAEFFCYWQQDDLCATNYLSTLHAHAVRHPDAACVYADVQWFGGRFGREVLPSVVGTAKERALEQLELAHFAPFRGLIRRRALDGAGPLRVTEYDSRLEDTVWTVKLAAQGDLHRTTDTMYFKRVHAANAHSSGRRLPRDFERRVWIEFGLGVFEAILPLFTLHERPRVLAIVLERLIMVRSGRWVFFDPWQEGPSEVVRFSNDFLDAVIARFGSDPWSQAARFPDPMAILQILEARRSSAMSCESDRNLIQLALRVRLFATLVETVTRERRWSTSTGEGHDGALLLEQGWSYAEAWGVWTHGDEAIIRLPIRDRAKWRVTLTGHGFVSNGSRELGVVVRQGGAQLSEWTCSAAEARFRKEFEVEGQGSGEGVLLKFEIRNATSPAEAGISADPRKLGLALESLEVERRE